VLWENNFHYDETRVDFGVFPIELHNRFKPAMAAMQYYQMVLLLFGAVALLFVRRSPRLLIVASMPIYTIAVHYSTQLNPRYAYLGMPALIVLAAAGAYGAWHYVKRLVRPSE